MTISRDSYGELISTIETSTKLTAAYALVKDAADKGKLPKAFDAMGWEKVSSRVGRKNIGTASYHELYDISMNGNKVLVCVRAVEGTRYGVSTTSKTYYIVGKCGTGYRVTEANKASAAKLAKAALNFGDAIKAL